MSTDCDVAVVGCGVIGSMTAIALRQAGFTVTALDSAEPGAGTAAGSASFFHDGEIFPVPEAGALRQLPRLLLDPMGPLVIDPAYLPQLIDWGMRLVKARSARSVDTAISALAQLNRHAIDELMASAALFGATDLIERAGGLKVCRDARSLEAASTEVDRLAREGFRAECIGVDALRVLEPAVSSDVAGAIFWPDSAHCTDPEMFSRKLGEHVRTSSTFVQAHATQLQPQPDGSWTVTANGSERTQIHARRVLVSAGARSHELLRPLGYAVPLASGRGYHLMLAPSEPRLHRPIIFFEPHFGATPLRSGLRLAGTIEFAAIDAPANKRRAEMLHELAAPYLPGIRLEPTSWWMGVRPMLPDSIPAIGQARAHKNLFYSFGHGHLGFTQAAISARCIVDLLAENAPPFPMNPFAIERFGRGRRR